MIEKEDVFASGALSAPLEMADNLNATVEAYDKLINKTRAVITVNKDEEESLTQVSQVLAQLQKQEQAMVDLQNKQAVAVNKLVKTQEAQKKEIESLNKKLKEKQKLEEGNTKAVEALDNRTGGLISSFRLLGKEMLALAKSPVFLAIGALIASYYALQSASEAYYTSSGEGEDAKAERLAAESAALNILKRRWAEVGKVVDEQRKQSIGLAATWSAILASLFGGDEAADAIVNASTRAQEETRTLDALGDEVAQHQLDRSKKELEMAELLYKAGQETLYTETQRLEFRKQEATLREGIIKTEIDFAQRELGSTIRLLANEYELGEEQLRNMSRTEQFTRLKEEDVKKIITAEKKLVDLKKSFFEEEKKNAKAIDGIYKGMSADRKKELIEGQKLKDEFEKEETRRLIRAQTIEENIKEQKEDKDKERFKNATDRTALGIAQRLAGFKVEKKEYDDLFQTISAFATATADLFRQYFSNRSADLDAEQRKFETMFNNRLLNAKGNAAEEKKIEFEKAEYLQAVEQRRREQIRKTAAYEKVISFAQAGINIALAITKALPNVLQVALVSALGAIQLTAIAAKKIPALYKGSKNFKGGIAKVGERGREMIIPPDGKPFLTPGQETIMHLDKGTIVVPHHETEDRLRAVGGSGFDLSPVVEEIRASKVNYVRIHNALYEERKNREGSIVRTRKRIFG